MTIDFFRFFFAFFSTVFSGNSKSTDRPLLLHHDHQGVVQLQNRCGRVVRPGLWDEPVLPPRLAAAPVGRRRRRGDDPAAGRQDLSVDGGGGPRDLALQGLEMIVRFFEKIDYSKQCSDDCD